MKRSILIVIVLFFVSSSFSQEKKYTTYRVKANETLSSIARKIGVTTYDLEKLNPDAKDGLHIDEVLIIPNKNYKKKKIKSFILPRTKNHKTASHKVMQDSIKNGILYHKVRAGETIYSLSKKYKVKKKKILKLNHLKKRAAISIGQVLKIPTDKKDTHPTKRKVIQDTSNSKYDKHTVIAGETKYTLARMHHIDVSELERINPFLKENVLRVGDEILVPRETLNIPDNSQTETNLPKLYTVKEEDTFYNFEHNLGIKKSDLIALNPQLKDGLKVGMQIVLPKKTVEQVATDMPNYKLHQVGFQETFYMLGKKYNVTEEQLKAINPELKDGLKEGMTIKIPLFENKFLEDAEMMMEGDLTGKQVNITMLLPFKSDVPVDFSKNDKRVDFLNKVTDFYFGALMALDSLQKKGLDVTLKVIDTKNDANVVRSIASTQDFSDSDFIIGPLVYSKYKEFAKNIPIDSIPLISPISKKNHALIFKSNVIQNTPKIEDIETAMLHFIKDNYRDQNLVIIADEGEEIKPKLARVKTFLMQNDSINEITILQMDENQIKREEFDKAVLKNKDNWFILVTDPKKTTTTSVAVNTLGAYPKEFNITLFALERGNNFTKSSLSNKNLNRLNVHFPIVTFVDKEAANIIRFNKKYFDRFGSFPTAYSYKGFDALYDASIRMANYNHLNQAYSAGNSYRLADKFKYGNSPYQGFFNKGVYIIEMKDFQLVQANPIINDRIEKKIDTKKESEKKE